MRIGSIGRGAASAARQIEARSKNFNDKHRVTKRVTNEGSVQYKFKDGFRTASRAESMKKKIAAVAFGVNRLVQEPMHDSTDLEQNPSQNHPEGDPDGGRPSSSSNVQQAGSAVDAPGSREAVSPEQGNAVPNGPQALPSGQVNGPRALSSGQVNGPRALSSGQVPATQTMRPVSGKNGSGRILPGNGAWSRAPGKPNQAGAGPSTLDAPIRSGAVPDRPGGAPRGVPQRDPLPEAGHGRANLRPVGIGRMGRRGYNVDLETLDRLPPDRALPLLRKCKEEIERRLAAASDDNPRKELEANLKGANDRIERREWEIRASSAFSYRAYRNCAYSELGHGFLGKGIQFDTSVTNNLDKLGEILKKYSLNEIQYGQTELPQKQIGLALLQLQNAKKNAESRRSQHPRDLTLAASIDFLSKAITAAEELRDRIGKLTR